MAQSNIDLIAALLQGITSSDKSRNSSDSSSSSSGRTTQTIPNGSSPVDPLYSYGDNHPTQTRGSQTIIDILENLGMDVGNIEQLIALLSQIPGLEAKDYQDQLYQLLLKQYLTAEQRNFDKSALSEQRNYDSPLNQLLRLQGAGIGRNAALQMLQGGANPALVGSGSEAALPSTVSSPSEKLMQGLQIGLDVISTVGSLMNMGFSAAGAIQQVDFLKSQNVLSNKQISAFDDASTAFSILNTAGSSADAFGSISSACVELTKLADNGNTDAAQFISQGRLDRLKSNANFASPVLSNLYRSERSSSDYDLSFGKYVEQTNAEIDFKKADKQRVEQQILNLKGELQQTIASTEFVQSQTALQKFHEDQIKAQTSLLRKQGKESEARALEIKAQTNLLVSQTKTIDLDNQLTQGIYDSNVEGKSGLEWLVQGRATDFYNDCQKFIGTKDRKVWEKELNAIASDYDRLFQLNLIRIAYEKGSFDKYKSDPEFQDFLNVCGAMHQQGAFDYLGIKLNAISEQYSGDDFVSPALKKKEIDDFRKQYGL